MTLCVLIEPCLWLPDLVLEECLSCNVYYVKIIRGRYSQMKNEYDVTEGAAFNMVSRLAEDVCRQRRSARPVNFASNT